MAIPFSYAIISYIIIEKNDLKLRFFLRDHFLVIFLKDRLRGNENHSEAEPMPSIDNFLWVWLLPPL
ncbi:hypothetical protein A2310_03125 [candidate division WOR-1 bacterium RIFOXYB2_FULL_37_13]|uniref:Uncharacterized protein n=1 Tax=candidate division WOR-1 bacterium RIFOXYB2_FULL_37_13 TaxID=1802579 RepID=A0A1F4SP29_UNCSA|nr:MAG: hypothetical protein A2310_03125 [candidate division WOR-1 bacterium RIFOXYB2_FULL_37_13]